MKKIVITLMIFSSIYTLHAQINYSQFIPLSVGNIWVYTCSGFGTYCLCNKIIKIEVTGIVTINNKTYFQTTRNDYTGSCFNGCGYIAFPGFPGLIRFDTANSNLLMYTTNQGCNYLSNEYLQDSFKARLNDSVRFNCKIMQGEMRYRCTDTSNISVFGQSRRSRSYSDEFFEAGYSRTYVYGIGFYSTNYSVIYCLYQSTTLKGCIIDGVVYGDTGTVVGIQQISTEIPEKYSLSQNYPNPFNPKTNIRFQVAESGKAELTIFDVLGREIAIIVNERMNPGVYEVSWDATKFVSGVYFYKLKINDYIETKKMVLLK